MARSARLSSTIPTILVIMLIPMVRSANSGESLPTTGSEHRVILDSISKVMVMVCGQPIRAATLMVT